MNLSALQIFYLIREMISGNLTHFPRTWPKTLRRIWLNLQVSLKKFTKNSILVKDMKKSPLFAINSRFKQKQHTSATTINNLEKNKN
jgi:hypothetical protein